MNRANRFFRLVTLLAAFAAPLAITGCAERHYRVYDPYYHDYHNWHDEDRYYRRWYGENYHDQYREYGRLNKDEQKRYWDWRHGHEHEH